MDNLYNFRERWVSSSIHTAEPGIYIPDDSTNMDLYEANTHPFILKIWLEESPGRNEAAKWRGYILHVPSGVRRHIEGLDDIIDFIIPYLEAMGVYVRIGCTHPQKNDPGDQ